jgi:hypothetical protein
MTNTIREGMYLQAVNEAKAELDELLPEYNRMQQRVDILRKFVSAGVVITGGDVRDTDEKYLPLVDRESWKNKHMSPISGGPNRNRFPHRGR